MHHVTRIAGPNHSSLAVNCRVALELALLEKGKLTEDLFAVTGYSGRKFRLFLNNLVELTDDARYLEIGVFNGASFCPALFGNSAVATAIDDWSWQQGSINLFKENLAKFTQGARVNVIENSFTKVDFASIGRYNIMFYDGAHSEKDQYLGVKLPFQAMDQTFILIVDDWNWRQVRTGTLAALRDVGGQVESSLEIRTNFSNTNMTDLPMINGPKSEWHNGTYIAVVSKGSVKPPDV